MLRDTYNAQKNASSIYLGLITSPYIIITTKDIAYAYKVARHCGVSPSVSVPLIS